MRDAIGQRFDLAAFEAGAALPDGAVFATRAQLLWALGGHDLFKGACIFDFDRGAVQADDAVLDLHLVPRQANQTLDVVAARYGVTEDHHIAALRLGPEKPIVVAVEHSADILGVNLDPDTGEHQAGARRIGIAVSHLVHEKEIADQQRLFHRPRRDPEGLEEQGPKDTGDQQRPEDCLDGFDKGVAGFFLGGHAALLTYRFGVTCGAVRAKSREAGPDRPAPRAYDAKRRGAPA